MREGGREGGSKSDFEALACRGAPSHSIPLYEIHRAIPILGGGGEQDVEEGQREERNGETTHQVGDAEERVTGFHRQNINRRKNKT